MLSSVLMCNVYVSCTVHVFISGLFQSVSRSMMSRLTKHVSLFITLPTFNAWFCLITGVSNWYNVYRYMSHFKQRVVTGLLDRGGDVKFRCLCKIWSQSARNWCVFFICTCQILEGAHAGPPPLNPSLLNVLNNQSVYVRTVPSITTILKNKSFKSK